MEALETAAAEGDGVVAGAAGEGLDVGDGGGVGEVPRVRVSLPAPRSTEPLETRCEGDGVGAGAADQGLDVGDGAGVAGGGEGELVGAGAEVDRHGGGQRGAEGDGVGAGAAGDGLGVGDGGGVGAVAEGQRVVAGAEVDARR